MDMDMRCGDTAALAGYLYQEISAEERAAVERHLSLCTSCAEEVAGLQDTRQMLAAWVPPETQLGFRVVADTAPVRRWWQVAMFPAWAQAAAALMLFAGGALVAAMMNMEVRYDQAGLTIRTGWQQRDVPMPPAVAAVSKDDLAALEARMRQELTRVHVTGGSGNRVASASGDMLERLQQMIAASEARQQRELALRVAQVVRDVDSTRRADIARIERTVSPLEGVTSEELLQQRQMLNYLMRVSEQK